MRKRNFLQIYTITSLVLIVSSCKQSTEQELVKLKYPEAEKTEHSDIYHNLEVGDPYHWMEDSKSSKVKEWISMQDSLTQNFVDESNFRAEVEKRIEQIGNFDSYGLPSKKGSFYFFSKSPKGGQPPIIFSQSSLTAKPNVVLDASSLVEDKELMSFGGYTISPDGKYISYRLSKKQSRWGVLKIFDIEKKKVLNDVIKGMRTKTTIWKHDGKGFFYAKYGDLDALESEKAKPLAQIYYHELGTDESQDKLVYG